jgi:ABC-type molybdate transport system substrate-binding protein
VTGDFVTRRQTDWLKRFSVLPLIIAVFLWPREARGREKEISVAAAAALEKATIYDGVKAKLVYGENISQAAQFVQSGNAQPGIIALSLASSPPMRGGKSWQIPAEMHPAIEQGAIVLKDAKNKDAARAFLEFVKGKEGRAILEKHGFETGGLSHRSASPS